MNETTPSYSENPYQPPDLPDVSDVADPAAAAADRDARNVTAFTAFLRGIGSLVLLVAASIFLFNNWESGSDLMRYGSLLGLTVVIAVTGFVCGLRIKESKSARTLLGMTLALVPVNFAVLAGLIYSRFALDASIDSLPDFAVWVAPSSSAALLTTLVAVVVLLPLVALSMMVMVRSQAKWMTLAFLGLNLPLLIPVRDPDWSALPILGLMALFTAIELRWVPKDPAFQTFEGKLSRLLLASPVALLFGRTAMYEPSYFLMGAALIGLSAFAFLMAPRLGGIGAKRQIGRVTQALQWTAVLPASLGWVLVVAGFVDTKQLAEPALLPLLTLPIATIAIAASMLSVGSGTALRRVTAGLVVWPLLANTVLFGSPLVSLLCLVVSSLVVAYSFIGQRPLLLVIGGLGAMVALVYQVRAALEVFDVSRWGVLALLGITAIVGAALVERHYERFRGLADRYRLQLLERFGEV